MKKLIVILALFALVCLGLYSCKTTDDCPAYNQIEKNDNGQRA
ncbi:MAG: hypothetical protein PHP52_13125 [Bacteroidales bacterium]|nr:hypothetical protein [Bacteroidales bacterium]MDD4217602.1 hypothetical protein [Bacteroidales bacterium]MDY0141926.1 hypothetical protein [Bacteroidales bacterium]